jgi:hypothetical protein
MAAPQNMHTVSAHDLRDSEAEEDSEHARRINGCPEETQRTELDVGYDFIQEESAVGETGKSVQDTSLAPIQPSLKVRTSSAPSHTALSSSGHIHSSSIKQCDTMMQTIE